MRSCRITLEYQSSDNTEIAMGDRAEEHQIEEPSNSAKKEFHCNSFLVTIVDV